MIANYHLSILCVQPTMRKFAIAIDREDDLNSDADVGTIEQVKQFIWACRHQPTITNLVSSAIHNFRDLQDEKRQPTSTEPSKPTKPINYSYDEDKLKQLCVRFAAATVLEPSMVTIDELKLSKSLKTYRDIYRGKLAADQIVLTRKMIEFLCRQRALMTAAKSFSTSLASSLGAFSAFDAYLVHYRIHLLRSPVARKKNDEKMRARLYTNSAGWRLDKKKTSAKLIVYNKCGSCEKNIEEKNSAYNCFNCCGLIHTEHSIFDCVPAQLVTHKNLPSFSDKIKELYYFHKSSATAVPIVDEDKEEDKTFSNSNWKHGYRLCKVCAEKHRKPEFVANCSQCGLTRLIAELKTDCDCGKCNLSDEATHICRRCINTIGNNGCINKKLQRYDRCPCGNESHWLVKLDSGLYNPHKLNCLRCNRRAGSITTFYNGDKPCCICLAEDQHKKLVAALDTSDAFKMLISPLLLEVGRYSDPVIKKPTPSSTSSSALSTAEDV